MTNDTNENVRLTIGAVTRRPGFDCIFEEENGAGRLYIADLGTDQIIKHLDLYSDTEGLLAPEVSDVKVLWSADGTRCGVEIWGEMRGIFNVVSGQACVARIFTRESPGVSDVEWLAGFENCVSTYKFVKARQRYWKRKAKETEPDWVESTDEQNLPNETNFMVSGQGPANIVGVFEDEGETGYLYVYNQQEDTIHQDVHVYNRSDHLAVESTDVRVLWSRRKTKCGVAIWGKMRGIVDLTTGQTGRVWLDSRSTPGIGDAEWLKGFRF